MRILLSIAVLFLFCGTAAAICALPRPRGPAGEVPPNQRDPTDPDPGPDPGTPTPDPEPRPDPTPTPTPGDEPGRKPPPNPGGKNGGGGAPRPGAPGRAGGGAVTGGARARPAGQNYRGSWHIWWELNREYLFGLRKYEQTPRDPEDTRSRTDILATYRSRVRRDLSKVAFEPRENDELRATSLRALGRAGTPADAAALLKEFVGKGRKGEIRESAAIGLASLREIRDEKTREAIREGFQRAIRPGGELKGRTLNIATLACGLRARDDELLAKALSERMRSGVRSSNEATALLFACGISRCELLTDELARVVERGRLGKRKVPDLARAHCVLGLAMCGGQSTAPTLTKLLIAKNVGVDTRRAAALGIGLLLREGKLDGVSDKMLQKALVHCFEKEHDQLVKGYCAIAMGAAEKPFLLTRLQKLFQKTGSATVKPYAALALGLAARTMGGKIEKKISRILLKELDKARDFDLAGAISIALGLARSEEAYPVLMKRASSKKLSGAARGPACEALGLMKKHDPEVVKILREAADDSNVHVSLHALLALGFLGQDGTGSVLAKKLVETRSPKVRIHLVVALSHLGGIEAIDPLLEIVNDRKIDHAIRSSAAGALGILLDPRARDPLFEIDAYANPYGLTVATRELVRIY